MGRLIAYGSHLGELSAELTERGKRNSALPPPFPKGEERFRPLRRLRRHLSQRARLF